MRKKFLCLTIALSLGLIGCADTQPLATVEATIEESTVEESTVEESTEEESTVEESSEEESTIEETEEQTEEAKRDGIYAFQIQINGVDYELPCAYQAFVSNGWEYKGNDEVTVLGESHETAIALKNGNNSFFTSAVNFGMNKASLEECYIGQIDINKYDMKSDGVEVVLPYGITFMSSTKEDVIKAYGEPTESNDHGDFTMLEYEYEIGSYAKLQFDNDTGVLSSIEMEYMKQPKGYDDSSSVDNVTIPDIAKTYKAPDKISDDLLDFTLELDGDLYQLPAPVAAFTANGWKIEESESDMELSGRRNGRAVLTKGDLELELAINNYSDDATICDYCFVQCVYPSAIKCDLPTKLSNNIALGMSESDLKSALKGYTVEEDGHYLTVRDGDSLMCFIEFEIFDGVLGSIRFSNSLTSEEYTNSLK